MSWLAIAVAVLGASAPVDLAGGPDYHRELAAELDVLADPGGALTLRDVAEGEAAGRFRPLSEGRRFGFTPAALWLRATLANNGPGELVRALTWDFPKAGELDFWLLHEDGRRERLRGGISVPPGERTIEHRGLSHRALLRLRPGEHVRLYVRARTELSMLAGLSAWSPPALLRRETLLLALLGIFLGAMLVVALIHAHAWLTLRDPGHPWFLALVASFTLYALGESGYAAAWLWPGHGWWAARATVLSAAVTLAVSLQFARVFLRGSPVPRAAARAAGALVPALPAAGLLALWDVRVASALTAAGAVLAAGLAVALAGFALANRQRSARGLAVGTALELLGCAVLGATLLGLVPPSQAGLLAAVLAFAPASLVLSFALTDWRAHAQRLRREELEAAVAERTAQLAKSEGELRTLLESANVGFALARGGEVTYANGYLLQLLGYAPDEVPRPLRVLDLMAPAFREQAAARLARRAAGDRAPASYECEFLRRDGRPVPVWLHTTVVEVPEGPELVVSAVDLSERRRGEQERARLEEQFRQAQKMEAVGRLAGGVAHDFNNALTAITGFAELAEAHLPAGSPAASHVAEVRRAAQRTFGLTRQLLAFSRRQGLAPRPTDLNRVAGEARKLLGRLLGEDVQLRFEPCAEPLVVRADPAQLEQALANLAVNARDAMPRGGLLEIRTEALELTAEQAAGQPDAAAGRWAVLSVRDTGCGMDEQVRSHLFEPFFTTKERGKGTGLGLATVYGVVRQAGGFVRVESEPGKGSTFRLHLPRAEETAQATPEPRPAVATAGGVETLLVVEDEPAVRDLAQRMLERLGYRVLAADGARSARRLFDQYSQSIALLVTDVVMPDGSGRELAEALQARRPALRVLYVSGHPESTLAPHGVLDPAVRLLAKPFTAAALGDAVRAALDA